MEHSNLIVKSQYITSHDAKFYVKKFPKYNKIYLFGKQFPSILFTPFFISNADYL